MGGGWGGRSCPRGPLVETSGFARCQQQEKQAVPGHGSPGPHGSEHATWRAHTASPREETRRWGRCGRKAGPGCLRQGRRGKQRKAPWDPAEASGQGSFRIRRGGGAPIPEICPVPASCPQPAA